MQVCVLHLLYLRYVFGMGERYALVVMTMTMMTGIYLSISVK